jgi:thioredoxin 1
MEQIHTREDWMSVIEYVDGVSVVMFTASWCGPCKKVKPYITGLANNPDIAQHKFKFVEIDIDELPELADTLKVENIPTIIFLFRGQIIDRMAGDQHQIHAAINTHYKLIYQ